MDDGPQSSLIFNAIEPHYMRPERLTRTIPIPIAPSQVQVARSIDRGGASKRVGASCRALGFEHGPYLLAVLSLTLGGWTAARSIPRSTPTWD